VLREEQRVVNRHVSGEKLPQLTIQLEQRDIRRSTEKQDAGHNISGDRFDDRRRIVPLRRSIDTRIEPIPFRPEQFANGGNLIDEIKKTGFSIIP
jgi:hypothetical protein